MKKLITISLIVGVLICTGVANTIAEPSDIFSVNPMDNQQISAEIDVAYNPLNKNERTQAADTKGSNTSALLSMSMIGLMLVGLAGFRGGRNKRKLD